MDGQLSGVFFAERSISCRLWLFVGARAQHRAKVFLINGLQ